MIEYDDFNPFLDRFRDRFGSRRRRANRVLSEWKLWDHMDAILSLGVTGLVDRVLDTKQPKIRRPTSWPRRMHRPRSTGTRCADLLILAACYDQSSAETGRGRCAACAGKLRYRAWPAQWDWALGFLVTLSTAGLIAYVEHWEWLQTPWPYLIAAGGWLPWLARVWRRCLAGGRCGPQSARRQTCHKPTPAYADALSPPTYRASRCRRSNARTTATNCLRNSKEFSKPSDSKGSSC